MTEHSRRRHPAVRYQFQTTECGVAALGLILAHHGRQVPLERIREATGVSRDCMNASDMVVAARHFGLECTVRKCEPDGLAGLGLPVVVYLNFIHFSVLEAVTETHMRLADPHGGRIELSHEQFNDQFTGIALSFAPTAAFRRDNTALRIPWLLRRIGWRGVARISVAALSAVCGGAATAAAAFAIATSDATALLVALAAMTVFTFLGRTALMALKLFLARTLSRAAIRHMLDMTPGFFSYRIPDRLVEVVHSSERIGKRLCEDVLPPWVGLAGLPVLLGGLWALYAPAGIALAGVAAVLGTAGALLNWAPWMRYVPPQPSSNDAYGNLFHALERIETWKTGGRTRDFLLDTLDTHAAQQARLARTRGHAIATRVYQNLALPVTIAAALGVVGPAMRDGLLDGPGALAVILLAAAMAPALSKWAAPWGAVRALHQDLFHLEDAMTAGMDDARPPAPSDEAGQPPPGILAELSDVRFGHSRQRRPILDGVGLAVRHGEQLGITGPSGGGKSTIARLIAGVEKPWSGTIRIGSSATTPVARAWLDKSPTFFEASLRDNLTLWRTDLPDPLIWSVLEEVCIADRIRAREGGLDAPIARMGGNFSGGQLQRLEIARALLAGANFLIIDEALDALNPELETRLRANLRNRGCTVVVVSHRNSTLAGCERVLRVVDGRVDGDGAKAEQCQSECSIAPPSAMGRVFNADVSSDGTNDADRWPVDGHLQSTFRHLAEVYRTRAPNDDNPTGTMNIDAMAAAHGFGLRPLRITDPGWWRLDGAPYLVRERTTKCVFAVMPGMAGPVLYDPIAARHRPFPKDPAGTFELEAFRVYPQQDRPARTPLECITRVLRSVHGDAVRFLIAILAIGTFSAAWPMTLTIGTGGLNFGFGAIALIAGLALFEVAAALHERRAETLTEHSLLHAFARRLAGISVPFVRASRREDIAAATQALPRIIAIFRQSPLRHLAGPVTSIVALGFLLLTGAAEEAVMALVAMLAGLVLTVAVAHVRVPHLDEARRRQSASRRFLFTALDGIFRFRALRADRRVLGEWQGRFQDALAPMRGNARLKAVSDSILAALPWAGIAGLVAWQGASVRPSTGFAVWLAIASASVFAQALGNWLDARAEVRRMALVTQAPEEPTAGPDVSRPDALSLHGIGAGFPGARILSDVTLSVRPGDVVAIAGASGSGKSTLIDVMLGFHAVDAGTIRIDGDDITACDVARWRSRVAAVLQRDRLDDAMTARGQIAGRAPIGLGEIWRLLRDVELDAEVAAMPMATQSIVDDFRLSTGQRQRLLLARALARRPRLLFLDEALSAVPDALKERLVKMIRAKAITAVIVTHDEHLIGLADRVCVLDRGRIAYDGAPGHVLGDPAFRKIFETEKRDE